jgi:hypothetical protein
MSARDQIAHALRMRLYLGTHTDRWNDTDWQERFWADGSDAVIATIRSLSPADLAELIEGKVLNPFGKHERVIGPWREVTPSEADTNWGSR